MLLLLVASDLRADGLNGGSGGFVTVELTLSGFLTADVFAIRPMEDTAAVLKDPEGKRTAETENDAKFSHLDCTGKFLLKTNLPKLPFFLLLSCNLLQDLLLSLQDGLHTGKILLELPLSEHMLI